jgi:hypothetical protein
LAGLPDEALSDKWLESWEALRPGSLPLRIKEMLTESRDQGFQASWHPSLLARIYFKTYKQIKSQLHVN